MTVGAALAATLALAGAGSSPEPTGHRLAVALASAGPRPAASAAERRAHDRVRRIFAASGLRVGGDAVAVPGRGTSRNVIGVHDTPASCLYVLMAHADTVAGTPGAEDNASGVGVLAAVARAGVTSRCDVWLVATGAEERIFTGSPDHLGALALVRRVRRLGRASDLRLALSLDEVGRGRRMVLRSSSSRGVSAVLRAARGTGLRVTWSREASAARGMSDHREFQMAGFGAAKLGVASASCRHTGCDTASRLTADTFPRVRRLVARLIR